MHYILDTISVFNGKVWDGHVTCLPASPAAERDSAPAALCPAPRRAAGGPSAASAAGTDGADVLAPSPAAGIQRCTAAGETDTDPAAPAQTPALRTSPAADGRKTRRSG